MGIYDKIQDLINKEPFEDDTEQEEYLDRLGIDEEEETDDTSLSPGASIREYDVSGTRGMAQASLGAARASMMDDISARREINAEERRVMFIEEEGQEHLSSVSTATSYGDNRTAVQQMDHQQMRRAVQWSNGDSEVIRPRSSHRQSEYKTRDMRYRRQTEEFVGKHTKYTRERLADYVLHDIQCMVRDFITGCERIPYPHFERVVEGMVDNYLDEISDYLLCRGRCRCEHSPERFGTQLYVQLELPGTGTREFHFDLELIRRNL